MAAGAGASREMLALVDSAPGRDAGSRECGEGAVSSTSSRLVVASHADALLARLHVPGGRNIELLPAKVSRLPVLFSLTRVSHLENSSNAPQCPQSARSSSAQTAATCSTAAPAREM